MEEKRRAALRALRNNWDRAAKEDAQHNVVTIPGQSEADFFKSGEREIDAFLERLEQREIKLDWNRAFDFGCGLGRLSVALARHFMAVVAVDVSGEMIARARKARGVRYLRTDTLAAFAEGTFDLVYSNITLQHMPGWLQQQYVGDFFKLVKPGGVVAFELPNWPDMEQVQHALAMGGADPHEVGDWITDAGGWLEICDVTESAGPSIPCFRYISIRRPE